MDHSVKSASVLLLLAAVGGGAQPPPAGSIVAAFDDAPPPSVAFIVDTPEPFLYKGLVWRGFSVIQSNHGSLAKFPRSGYARGAVSGTFAAVAAGRAFSESTIEKHGGGAFIFYGAHLTAAWRTGLEVTLDGLRGGDVVFVRELSASPTETVALSGAWEIDMLRIRASGGDNGDVCLPAACHPGPELVIDDFTFSLAAEGAPNAVGSIGEMPVFGGETFQPSIVSGEIAADEKTLYAQAPAAPEPQAGQEERQPPAPLAAKAAQPPEPSGACDGAPYFGVQVGVFSRESNALRLRSALGQTYSVVRIYLRRHPPPKGVLHHLVVGCGEERSEAVTLHGALSAEGKQGFVIEVNAETFGEPL